MISIRHAVSLATVTAVLVLSSLAVAGGGGDARKLEYVLSGPPINGVVPSGKAVIDQPSLPGVLTCEVRNVNLPDGTSLIVSVNRYPAGTLNLMGGQARLQTTIPFQVRTGPFEILLGNTVIMTGRWKL